MLPQFILTVFAFLATVASASRCTSIPMEDFKSGQEFYVVFYGQVTREIGSDVNVHTYLYDKDVANWCKILVAHGGRCPMDPEDGFKLGVRHMVEANVEGPIKVVSEIVDGKGACVAVTEGSMPVVQ
ncbi:hypothetical protein BGZ73_002969 [Actinomortierella ambigua]|nr:hypothetical protein BGZ73_002969 [Actinomortierella ambigua]